MNHDIRILSSDAELEQALTVFYTSLVGFPVPTGGEISDYYEPGRTIGVFDDDRVVATATSFGSWLMVPGGARVPHCAITDLGVLPTYKRRGMAGAMVARQFQDAADRGEIIATLRASEAGIYERFGYGVATRAESVELAVRTATLRPELLAATAGSPVRLVDRAASWDLLASIHAPIDRPGAIDRHVYWWRGQQHYAASQQHASYVAVHGAPGAEDGFVQYRPVDSDTWFSHHDNKLAVYDLVARTDAAYLGLLRFLLSIDLVDTIELQTLPVDHGLPGLLLDGRAARTTGSRDETWLRLIDAGAALSARTYQGDGVVTIAVRDDLIPANTGSYRISADGAERTRAAADLADLAVDVATLAAAYLGGTPWWQLARAGRVSEQSDGAVATADALFATSRAPFAGTSF